MERAADHLSVTRDAIAKLDGEAIGRFHDLLWEAYLRGRKVFLCGNGGSASTSSHFAQDLAKGTIPGKGTEKRLRAIALTDNVSYITALANDQGYDDVFVEQLRNLAEPGDLLIAISGSGNSANVLRAVGWGNDHGLETVGITGFDGGKLRWMAKYSVHVPVMHMGIAESVHLVLVHVTVECLAERIHASCSVLR